MNGYERSMAVIRHQLPDRVPVIPQDSHMAARHAGYDHIEFHTDVDKMARAHVQWMEEFDLDGTFVGSDTVCLAEAVGVQIALSADHCPRFVAGCIDDYSQVKDLKIPDPYKAGRMPIWIEATRKIVEMTRGEKLIIARADQGAFSLASMMRGMQEFLLDIAIGEEEEGIQNLLRYCNECMYVFIQALKEAGAHVVTTGDSISGPSVVSPAVYEAFSFPYELDMANRCKALGIPFSIHICGKTDAIAEKWAQTRAEIFEVDHLTDFNAIRRYTVGTTTLLGNLDTSKVMLSGSPELVIEKSRELFDSVMPQGDFILSSGCLLGETVPHDNIRAMVEASRRYGVYGRKG